MSSRAGGLSGAKASEGSACRALGSGRCGEKADPSAGDQLRDDRSGGRPRDDGEGGPDDGEVTGGGASPGLPLVCHPERVAGAERRRARDLLVAPRVWAGSGGIADPSRPDGYAVGLRFPARRQEFDHGQEGEGPMLGVRNRKWIGFGLAVVALVSACSLIPTTVPPPGTSVAATNPAPTDVPQTSSNPAEVCPTPDANTTLYLSRENGFCFLVPLGIEVRPDPLRPDEMIFLQGPRDRRSQAAGDGGRVDAGGAEWPSRWPG